MKICHVTSVHPRYDIRIFEKECVSLAKNGYETYLVVNDEQPDELIKGVSIVSTGFSPKKRRERFLKSSSKALKKEYLRRRLDVLCSVVIILHFAHVIFLEIAK